LARSALLTAAAPPFQAFSPIWSTAILNELARNLRGKAAMSEARVEGVLGSMRSSFPKALVDPDPEAVRHMPNHPKDRHVLAVAVLAPAQVLVTNNTRDFRGATWLRVQVQTPDEFLTGLCGKQLATMRAVVEAQAAALKAPSITVDELLGRYARTGFPRLAARLRDVSA
jgi:predicted nucleic acid-binding protein